MYKKVTFLRNYREILFAKQINSILLMRINEANNQYKQKNSNNVKNITKMPQYYFIIK